MQYGMDMTGSAKITCLQGKVATGFEPTAKFTRAKTTPENVCQSDETLKPPYKPVLVMVSPSSAFFTKKIRKTAMK